MKNILLLVIFILGLVIMQYVRSPSVDDIINRYLEARGGKDKLKAIRSVFMEGSREMLGNKVPVKVTLVPDQLYRTDFELGNTNGFTIVTPAEGWSYIPIQSHQVDPIDVDQLSTMQLQLDIAGPFVDHMAKGNKVELDGKDVINGREAYKIDLTLANGNTVTYYIDQETDLLVQSKLVSVDNAFKEIITNYSDYKLFDGIMFPQTISNPGVMGGTTTFDMISINDTIDESVFKASV